MPFDETVFGDGTSLMEDTMLGALTGLGVVALSWRLRHLRAVARLNGELSKLLGRPSTTTIAVLAVTSAVGEELLFRGALQGWCGFWPTALLFGFMHGGTARAFRVWVVFATLAGLLLGWLMLHTENLMAPILCHFTINYFNLHLLGNDRMKSL